MLNANDYKTGYEHGLEDARANKDKRYRFNGLSWKYWLNSEYASKTYIEGYDAGYLDAIREKNIVHKTKNETNNVNAASNKKNEKMINEVYYCKNCRRQQSIDDGEFCQICGKLTVSWFTDTEKEDDAIRKWDNINGRNNINQIPIYTNNNLITNKSNSMANTQKIQLQLQKLQEMENFLGQLQAQFQQNIKIYNDKMLMLRQSGMSEEVCNTYDQRYKTPKIQTMNKMMQEINQLDVPYIKKNILAMQNALQAATK